MTPTLNRKDRERKFREELILDTAAAMLLNEGYLGLNLDRLAEKVEYSKGTLYLHFDGKEDLILAIAARNLKERVDLFEHAVTLSGRPREKAFALGVADLVFLHHHPVHFQIEPLVKQTSIWERGSAKRQQEFDLNIKICLDILRRLMEDGAKHGDLDLSKIKPEAVTFGLWSMSYGAYSLARSQALLKTIGLEKPLRTLIHDRSLFLDGVGWKPLSTSWDYNATLDRVFKDLFPGVSRQKIGL
jgi:AcrR family transcriptional regulator